MKRVIILGVLACAGLPAHGATPTEAYEAARDRVLAIWHTPEGTKPPVDPGKAEKPELAKMLPLLRAAIGPLHVTGFPDTGASNLAVFEDEPGSGTLDGISATSLNKKTTVVVTTDGLLRAWLVKRRNEPDSDMPATPEAAFESEAFYTQSVFTNAAASLYVGVPVAAPKDGQAVAHLLTFAQDIVAPNPPAELDVVVVRDGRVFLFNEKVKPKVTTPATCKAAYRRDEAATNRLDAAYQAGGSKDEALFDRYTKSQTTDDVNFRKCFAAQASAQPYFPAVVQQAQALVDRVQPK